MKVDEGTGGGTDLRKSSVVRAARNSLMLVGSVIRNTYSGYPEATAPNSEGLLL